MALDLLTPHALDYANPVNRQSPLNRGLMNWWRVLPQTASGQRLRDLVGRSPAGLTSLSPSSATTGWGPTSRRGGMGEIRFPGPNTSGGYLNVGDLKWLTGTAAVSFTAWLKPGVINTQMGILSKAVSGTVAFNVETWNDNFLYVEIFNGAATDGHINFTTWATAGVWLHMAAVYNGAGATNAAKLQIYINGVAKSMAYNGTLPATLSSSLGGSTLYLGRYLVGASDFRWQGALDDLRLYNRVLTDDEVKAVYLSSLLRYPTELGRRAPLWLVPLLPGVLGAYALLADPGTLALAGTAIPARLSMVADPASSTLAALDTPSRLSMVATPSGLSLAGTGTPQRLSLVASSGSSTLTGTTTLSRVSMVASPGAISVGGLATLPRLLASAGALSVAGTATIPRVSLTATSSSSTLTGTASPARLSMVATSGACMVTGTATITRLFATPGALALAGTAISVRVSLLAAPTPAQLQATATPLRLTVPVTAGALALAGQAVSLRATHRLVALSADTQVLGGDAILRHTGQTVISAASGSLDLDGMVVLRHLVRMAALSSALTLTGTLAASRLTLAAANGSVVSTGQPATLTHLGALLATSATSTVLGTAAAFRSIHRLLATSGEVDALGTEAILRHTGQTVIGAESGDLTVDGQALLRHTAHLPAVSNPVLLTGSAVVLFLRHHYDLRAESATVRVEGTPAVPPALPPARLRVVEYPDHTEVYSPTGTLLRSIRKHHLSYWQTYQRRVKR